MTDYTELVKALRICSGFVKFPSIEALQATIELMKPYMPDFFPDANKVTLPKMEVQDGK